MARAQPDRQVGQFTGRHMLIIMLLFFAVIIGVNITMAVLASRSWTGLVVKNSYVASQHFNEGLRAAREQRKRGWKSSLTYESNHIQLSLRDRHNQPIVLDGLRLSYGRPAFEQADGMVMLTLIGNGLYQAPVSLKAGVWALKISSANSARPYRRDSRIRVTDDGTSGQEE
jgi:nitrogen fixation protein FixH